MINVGDMIEGYSDDKAELNAEWDEVDAMLNELEDAVLPTPGNHDIANDVAQQVWRTDTAPGTIISSTTIRCSWSSTVKTRPARLPRA